MGLGGAGGDDELVADGDGARPGEGDGLGLDVGPGIEKVHGEAEVGNAVQPEADAQPEGGGVFQINGLELAVEAAAACVHVQVDVAGEPGTGVV